ncbi:hypothetical protein F5884DRAFT_181456 [Xylogone sp. PMI_703]|nr:hypothetical protein F5884DRAFT_181456 [Xylogone sp. PMI_703]
MRNHTALAKHENGIDTGKVPTALATVQLEGIREWGFLCNAIDEDKMWRLFKMCLDPNHFNRDELGDIASVPKDMSEVRYAVTEYLHQIYRHISIAIPEDIRLHGEEAIPNGHWKDWEVEFIFSVPTTWSNSVIADFLTIAQAAGFQSERHRVSLGLTEAQAAAVAAFGTRKPGFTISEGDIFLSIDAGGGTTDLAFMKVKSTSPLTLDQDIEVSGSKIGSVMIDMDFMKLVQNRLQGCSQPQRHLVKACALKMSQSRQFQEWKHRYGQRFWQEETYKFPMEHHESFLGADIGVENGHMVFTNQELGRLFDDQIAGIKRLIKKALDVFDSKYKDSGKSVKYVVLSGRLGSSAHLLQKLEEYFRDEGAERHSVSDTRVFICTKPQLAVAMGLLYNWKNLLQTQIAQTNYGVIFQRSHPKKPQLFRINVEEGVPDPIHWLIRKGQKIKVDDSYSLTIERESSKGLRVLDGKHRLSGG